MKKFAVVLFVLLLILGSCSTTLSVQTPAGMYLSMGDYVEGVTTLGVIQEHKTVWTPLIVLYDPSEIREDLYKDLLRKAERMRGNGITNVTFYSKPSPWSVLSIPTFGLGIWVDYYIEGIAIQTQ